LEPQEGTQVANAHRLFVIQLQPISNSFNTSHHKYSHLLSSATGGEYFNVSAIFPRTIEIKGWRKEFMKLCCHWVAYCERGGSIHYVDHSLHADLWFKEEGNMLRFINEVTLSHNTFCSLYPEIERFINRVTVSHNTFCSLYPEIEWNYSCEPRQSPYLIPVMIKDYRSNDSSSPEHTDIPFHESSSSVVSISLAKVYFRLVEDESEFFDIKPTSCHIADMALLNDHDSSDVDNRLYLTQALHSRFDGMQTSDSIPHVGIYFVENAGKEEVTYGGAQYTMDRIIVGFEIPFEGVAAKIKFKPGTYRQGDIYYTHIHVINACNVKKYLDLKYHNTMNRWDARGIQFNHRIDLDEEYL
jgi:hypothetical protein